MRSPGDGEQRKHAELFHLVAVEDFAAQLIQFLRHGLGCCRQQAGLQTWAGVAPELRAKAMPSAIAGALGQGFFGAGQLIAALDGQRQLAQGRRTSSFLLL